MMVITGMFSSMSERAMRQFAGEDTLVQNPGGSATLKRGRGCERTFRMHIADFLDLQRALPGTSRTYRAKQTIGVGIDDASNDGKRT
jgi:hypothetical protein